MRRQLGDCDTSAWRCGAPATVRAQCACRAHRACPAIAAARTVSSTPAGQPPAVCASGTIYRANVIMMRGAHHLLHTGPPSGDAGSTRTVCACCHHEGLQVPGSARAMPLSRDRRIYSPVHWGASDWGLGSGQVLGRFTHLLRRIEVRALVPDVGVDGHGARRLVAAVAQPVVDLRTAP